ncbi:MAG: hypothetical protein ACRY3E_00065 [Candidatus Lariskella arthropodorum]
MENVKAILEALTSGRFGVQQNSIRYRLFVIQQNPIRYRPLLEEYL